MKIFKRYLVNREEDQTEIEIELIFASFCERVFLGLLTSLWEDYRLHYRIFNGSFDFWVSQSVVWFSDLWILVINSIKKEIVILQPSLQPHYYPTEFRFLKKKLSITVCVCAHARARVCLYLVELCLFLEFVCNCYY